MKIGKLFLAGIVALGLGLTGCNNDDVPELSGEKEATISIKVFPSSNGPTLRATGDLTAPGVESAGLPAESDIKSLEVWVFSGDVLDGYGTAQADEVKEIEAHIGTRSVVVAANANIGAITSKATLLATLKELPTDIATNGLIMTAEPFNITLEKGKNYWGYTGTDEAGVHKYHETNPLAITRVNARVAIVGATLSNADIPDNQVPIFDALGDVQVAMFNVPEKTKLFGSPLATDAGYLYGAQWPSPAGTYEGVLDDPATPTASLTDNVDGLPVVITDAPYYYVNESSVENKMLIVLRAKLYKGGTVVDPTTNEHLVGLYIDSEGYTYYPIWVNGKDLGYDYGETYAADGKVVRNTQYNISLTIKGLGNPTIDPVEKAWLDVKVRVAPWIVVGQNVTW